MKWTYNEWSALGSLLSGVGAILAAGAVLTAAIIGSRTFHSWRRQKLSERRIEQAERILTATHKARRALAYVRNPLILGHERAAAEQHLEGQDAWSSVATDRKEGFITSQVYYNRLNRTSEQRHAIEDCLPMAQALFGEDVEKALDTLDQQFHIISVSAEAQSWDVEDKEFARSTQRDLSSFSSKAKPNKMNEVINAQVKIIEEHCVPVLRLDDRQHKKA